MNNGSEQESSVVLWANLDLGRMRKWALILSEACSIIPYFSYLAPSGAAITGLIAHVREEFLELGTLQITSVLFSVKQDWL